MPQRGDFGPQPVGDVLARYMRTSGLKEKLRSPEIYDCWPEVAGAEARKHSRVVGFSNCVLHVEVDSAPWLQRLEAFEKPELLRSLRALMRGVRVTDIKFRIGNCGPQSWPQINADSADKKRCKMGKEKTGFG